MHFRLPVLLLSFSVFVLLGTATSFRFSNYTSWLERLVAWNEATQPNASTVAVSSSSSSTVSPPVTVKKRNPAEEWFNRTGPGYVLKLFSLIPYNAKASQIVWSPVSLKLSLLALASLDRSRERNVYRFLFDLQAPPAARPTSTAAQSRTSLEDNLRSFNARILHPQTWSESVSYWWNVIVSTVLHLGYRHQTATGEGAFLTSTLLSSNLKRSQLYEMCQAFDYRPLHTVSECAHYLAVPHYLSPPSPLTNAQKVALCRAFSIAHFDDCRGVFANDSDENIYREVTYSTEDVAWALMREFHAPWAQTISGTKIPDICQITRGIVSNGTVDAKRLGSRWADRHRPMDFWEVRGNDFSKWEATKRSLSLWSSTLPASLPAPSFLSLVDFQQEFAQRFAPLGSRPFYGPKKWGLVTSQVATLFSRGHYGRVHHVTGKLWHCLVRIPYLNDKFSLVLLLPHLDSTVPEMMASLTPAQLQLYFKRLHIETTSISLTMPKFTPLGDFDFRPVLEEHNLVNFHLTNNSTAMLNFPQFIRVGKQQLGPHEEEVAIDERFHFEELGSSDDHVHVNRPFVFLIIGKYIDLYHKPAFDVLIAGYYNGPEN